MLLSPLIIRSLTQLKERERYYMKRYGCATREEMLEKRAADIAALTASFHEQQDESNMEFSALDIMSKPFMVHWTSEGLECE